MIIFIYLMNNIPIAKAVPFTDIVPSAPPLVNIIQQQPNSTNNNMERFQNIVEKYNISYFFAQQLRQLDSFEICIICDDSGSMSNPVKDPSNPFEKKETRWSEAQNSLRIITDIASIFDPSGIDIYYLNRQPIRNVFSSEELNNYQQFFNPPNGFTPLGERIQEVLEEKKSCERNLLLIVFTDGQPNNMKLFMDVLKNRQPIDKIYITIVACTDDESSIGYLNDLDKKIKNLDVCDDYNSEKQQILKIQGSKFSFTFGDYIVKTLLGAIDKNMDKLDEVRLNGQQLLDLKSGKPNKKSTCIVS